MSNSGATQRNSASSSYPSTENPDQTLKSPKKTLNNFEFVFPFDLPATPEAAAARIIKNLRHYSLFYRLILWVGLSISLVPARPYSLLLLMGMTIVANSYLILLQLMPNPILRYRAVDKFLVNALLGIVTLVGLIITEAAVHLFVTLGIGVPIVLVHAVFWRDDLFVSKSTPASASSVADDELAPLVDKV